MEGVKEIVALAATGLLVFYTTILEAKIRRLKDKCFKYQTLENEEGQKVGYGVLYDGKSSFAFSHYEMNKAGRRFKRLSAIKSKNTTKVILKKHESTRKQK